jgi:hypothetical protein
MAKGQPAISNGHLLHQHGCQCMTVNNVAININTNSCRHLISPYELINVDFMFGEMIHLTNTPAMHVPSSAIECPATYPPQQRQSGMGFRATSARHTTLRP